MYHLAITGVCSQALAGVADLKELKAFATDER